LEYILKHKEIPVMIFEMDEENFKLLDIKEIINEERLPFGLKDKGNKIQYAIQFNNWLTGRGLSESRKDLPNLKKQFNAASARELMIKAYGLNLTDHYWFHNINNEMTWKENNYFENTFDKVIPGKGINPEIDESVNKQSPNLCVDGSIEKRWIIKNGERVLLKGSLYNRMQEPFNEVIASKILDEFKIDHVNYKIERTKEKNIPYCECKCMVDKNTEYINAQYIMNMEEYYRKEPYIHYPEICKKNGLLDTKERIDEMIVLDFLIGNVDRHKGNFGIIREANTLKWIKIAPLFDNGNCLFYDSENDDMESWGIDTMGKAFGDSNRLNLLNIDNPDWYNKENKNKIIDIIADSLHNNGKLMSNRIDKVVEIVKKRIDILENMIFG
jgi:hypothetical protein